MDFWPLIGRPKPPRQPCLNCGAYSWWKRVFGGWECSRCTHIVTDRSVGPASDQGATDDSE
jgi:ribosomal protein L37AE/L43A